MTSSIEDLVGSTFHVSYYMNISPLEVDNLSTFEMREYINLLNKKIKSNNERDSSIFKSFSKLFGRG